MELILAIGAFIAFYVALFVIFRGVGAQNRESDRVSEELMESLERKENRD